MSTKLALISFVAATLHVGAAQADDVLRVRLTPFCVTVSGDGRKSRKSDTSTAWPMPAIRLLFAQRCARKATQQRPAGSSVKTIPTPFRVSRHRRGSAVGPTIERNTRPAKGAADRADRPTLPTIDKGLLTLVRPVADPVAHFAEENVDLESWTLDMRE